MIENLNSASNLLHCFLYENFPDKRFYLDLLRHEFDLRFYYYGRHYKYSQEEKQEFGYTIKEMLVNAGIDFFVFLNQHSQKNNKINILSTAYFNIQDKMTCDHINITRPPWQYNKNSANIFDYSIYKKAKQLKKAIRYATFNELWSDAFIEKIIAFEVELKLFIKSNNIQALFLPADVGFFEKLSIKVFKQLNYPTFIFLHGIPGGYTTSENNRTDYLVVWGEAIKRNFINAGIPTKKIIVSGHPCYNIRDINKLKFGLDNILIITKSQQGAQFGGRYVLRDRSNLITYLLLIQTALQKIGVQKVRLRPHPSESSKWYSDYVDTNFFVIDYQPLALSLERSSLVIGPTSTVFLESLLKGVNYIVFEPRLPEGTGFDGNILVPPFNGTNEKVPCAETIKELHNIIAFKKEVDVTILKDYISPSFKYDEIINLITKKIK